MAQKAFYQVYWLCQTLGFACDYPPSEWRTKGKNQQIIPMLSHPPHEPTPHGLLRCGWEQGSLGHRTAVRGSQMRPEIEDSGQWSPKCSSGAPVAFLRHPVGPWSLQFPVWLPSLESTETGTIQSHKTHSYDTCDHQTRDSRDPRDNLPWREGQSPTARIQDRTSPSPNSTTSGKSWLLSQPQFLYLWNKILAPTLQGFRD